MGKSMKGSLVQSHSPSSRVVKYLPSGPWQGLRSREDLLVKKKNSDADKEVYFFRKQVAPKKALHEGSAF